MKVADRHRRELVFSLGDWVLLRFEKARLRKMKGKERLFPKLGMRYYGPFQVCDKIRDVAYRLKLLEGWKIHNAFHVSLLRAFVGDVPEDMVPEEQPDVEELDEILVLEQILAHKDRKVRGKVARRYLVKFNIYSPMDAKWMEEAELVELHGTKVYCVSKAIPVLPFNLEDAARSEKDFQKAAEQEDLQYVRVNIDTRLNFRVLDLRTPSNQAIFRVQSYVSLLFRQFLVSQSFVEIHTPKLIAGASEGGAAVFKLDYKGQPACLAQSPQLHKQMAICADFGLVFEIGPVFRAENAFTHRHLCEFTGLDLEMEIKEHYSEVLDILDGMFVSIFDGLNEHCKKELEAINEQYPFEPLKYLKKTLRLTFEEGLQLLKEDGIELDTFGDLDTVSERRLGALVKNKYDTDFYILHRYPLAVRPFYTMPCYDNPEYSNSFDVFIRGEEIISGAQRVHDPELLVSRAQALGIDAGSLSTYIDSFRWGAVPHGGAGVGLERVVMLFCNLKNIRKTSMFPRDPTRLAP
ncbi:hypothetical protein L7F22_018435 [Adiantum nelumboides]|nr:hypothetical protein [Adiantum nelumboides]